MVVLKIYYKHVIPIIRRTVSGLNGVHVPFDKACCSSSALIAPDLSLSTLIKTKSLIIKCYSITLPNLFLSILNFVNVAMITLGSEKRIFFLDEKLYLLQI